MTRFLMIATLGVLLMMMPYSSVAGQTIGIAIGSDVEVTSGGQNLHLRSEPSVSSTIIANLPDGTRMTVIAGPQTSDGFTWWKISGDPGKGWAAESYLRPLSDQPNPAGIETPVTNESDECRQLFKGIKYCEYLDNKIHTVEIDLDNPHIRFETILANDTSSVNTSNRERVRDMAVRLPYKNGIVAVINADYFGGGHGPEGLTIKNGTRLDGMNNHDDDYGAVNRSSLVIGKAFLDGGGKVISADVTRLQDDYQVLNPDSFFTAVGGGPQVFYAGDWKWERNPSNNDRINDEPFFRTGDWDSNDKPWSTIAITNDQRMIWITAPFKLVTQTLNRYPVDEAIKLDGGGSTQLWVDGKEVVPSSDGRAVADALGVFYLHAIEPVSDLNWHVVVEGKTTEIQLELKNIGADTWNPGHVVLRNIEGPFEGMKQLPLTEEIPPNHTFTWKWTVSPSGDWGIRLSEWEVAFDGESFPGESIKIQYVVIPATLEDKKEEIETKIKEWINQGIENIQDRILEYISKLLNPSVICGQPFSMVFIMAGMLYITRSRLSAIKNKDQNHDGK